MKMNDSLHLGSPQEYIITQKALRYTMGHISVEGSKEKRGQFHGGSTLHC